MHIHSKLDPATRAQLIAHCGSALWHQRYGQRTTHYLAVQVARREAEAVLLAAERFLAQQGRPDRKG